MGKGTSATVVPEGGLVPHWALSLKQTFAGLAQDPKTKQNHELRTLLRAKALRSQKEASKAASDCRAQVDRVGELYPGWEKDEKLARKALTAAAQAFDAYEETRFFKSALSTSDWDRLRELAYQNLEAGESPARVARELRSHFEEMPRWVADNADFNHYISAEGQLPEDMMPLVDMLRSEDFQELFNNGFSLSICDDAESPSSTALENLVREVIAGMGNTTPDPHHPTAGVWRNPVSGNLYHIEMLPKYSGTDAFDIIVNVTEEGKPTRQFRVSVKAPSDKRDIDEMAEGAVQLSRNRRKLKVPIMHQINDGEIKNPDLAFERFRDMVIGGEVLLCADVLDNMHDKTPVVSVAKLRIVSPVVRRAVALAPYMNVEKRFVTGGKGKGRFEWVIPDVAMPDGGTYDVVFRHNLYYQADGDQPLLDSSGQLVLAGGGKATADMFIDLPFRKGERSLQSPAPDVFEGAWIWGPAKSLF